MTASKYEINHSPVHPIMSAAVTHLGEIVIYFSLPFCGCHDLRVESISRSKEVMNDWQIYPLTKHPERQVSLDCIDMGLSCDWKFLMWRKMKTPGSGCFEESRTGAGRATCIQTDGTFASGLPWERRAAASVTPIEVDCSRNIKVLPGFTGWQYIFLHGVIATTQLQGALCSSCVTLRETQDVRLGHSVNSSLRMNPAACRCNSLMLL